MQSLYFDANQSAAAFTGNDELSVLNLIAGHFIGNHPPLPFQYKLDFDNGILCDKKGRYQFDFGNRFPDTPIGSCCTALGKLFSYQDRTSTFTLSCIGPTFCYVNGELCYASSPQTEGLHEECQFQVSLKQGYNLFAFVTEKTELGFGFSFGNAMAQWEPYLFCSPLPERDGQLGFVYTPPLPFDRAKTATQNSSEFSWFPLLANYSKEDLHNLYPERVLGEHWSGTCFAIGEIQIESYSTLSIQAEKEITDQTGRAFAIYVVPNRKAWTSTPAPSAILDDSSTSCNLEFKRGTYKIYVQITRPLGKYRTSLKFQLISGNVRPICYVRGYHGNWLYLGSFQKQLPELEELTHFEQVYRDGDRSVYWQTNYPHGVLRMCVDTELYGRWTYPMGVTLYGLLKVGEYLNRPDYCDYVRRNVEQITSFQEYALFDKERFGFPSLNQQICWLTELDDCGSFGSLMLECRKHWELKGSDALADTIAHFMKNEQKRQPDGAFCRSDDTMWIDDMYMSIPFLVRYYSKTGDSYYLDEACRQVLLFREYFYMPDKHLMSHIYDIKWKKANRIPWSRGNGWVLFSISELMEVLPRDHKDREAILKFFQDMVDGVLSVQGKHGLWHQVLDDPTTYEETSSTAMFICAFSRSIRRGYIKDKHLVPLMYKKIQEAWNGLTHYAIDCHGNVYGVCQGSGRSFSRNYYRTLSWRYNDAHGIGIILLAGMEKCLLDES